MEISLCVLLTCCLSQMSILTCLMPSTWWSRRAWKILALHVFKLLYCIPPAMVCIHDRKCLYFFCVLGERRIRVHTLALPITDKLSDLYSACNITAIVGMLGKMGELMYVCLYYDVYVSIFSCSCWQSRECNFGWCKRGELYSMIATIDWMCCNWSTHC